MKAMERFDLHECKDLPDFVAADGGLAVQEELGRLTRRICIANGIVKLRLAMKQLRLRDALQRSILAWHAWFAEGRGRRELGGLRAASDPQLKNPLAGARTEPAERPYKVGGDGHLQNERGRAKIEPSVSSFFRWNCCLFRRIGFPFEITSNHSVHGSASGPQARNLFSN